MERKLREKGSRCEWKESFGRREAGVNGKKASGEEDVSVKEKNGLGEGNSSVNSKKFSEAMNEIDEKYIAEALGKGDRSDVKRRKRRKRLVRIERMIKVGSLAACLALLVAVGVRFLDDPDPIFPIGTEEATQPPEETGESSPQTMETGEPSSSADVTDEPTQPSGQTTAPASPSDTTEATQASSESAAVPSDLPMLTAAFRSDGMGMEALMYHNKEELIQSHSANPWTAEAELTVLPVYRNLALDKNYFPVYLSEEELLERAETMAETLGTTITETKYDTAPSGKVYSLTAGTGFGRIRVDGNGVIVVSFEEPVALPEGYRFPYTDISDAEAEKTTEYLLEQYAVLHGWEEPLITNWYDYSFSGQRLMKYAAYDGSGDLLQRILNYHFAEISFSPDPEEKLGGIRKEDQLTAAEKVGDYPIISPKTAEQLLLNGEYITSVVQPGLLEDDVIKSEHIVHMELVYRNASWDEYFMPYYRFYVELTEYHDAEAEENGLKHYGAYYVPAVSGEYLSDYPVWDGSFN